MNTAYTGKRRIWHPLRLTSLAFHRLPRRLWRLERWSKLLESTAAAAADRWSTGSRKQRDNVSDDAERLGSSVGQLPSNGGCRRTPDACRLPADGGQQDARISSWLRTTAARKSTRVRPQVLSADYAGWLRTTTGKHEHGNVKRSSTLRSNYVRAADGGPKTIASVSPRRVVFLRATGRTMDRCGQRSASTTATVWLQLICGRSEADERLLSTASRL